MRLELVPVAEDLAKKKTNSYSSYGAAVVLALLAFFLAFVITPIAGSFAYIILFFPVITVSARFGGLKAGVLTAVLLTCGALYLLLYRHTTVVPSEMVSYVTLFIVVLEGLFISYIIDKSIQQTELVEYRKREADYLHRITILEQKYHKAEDEIRARDEFLSIASHELKTPLTSMLLQLQTALHNIRNVSLANFSVENLMKMLDSAEHQSKRLSKMINDLLNVSLITTGKLHLELEDFDMKDLVNDVVVQFAEKLKRQGYTLDLETDKEIHVHWDKLRIEQVLTNLISNAMKYGKNNPITVKVKKHGDKVKITVTDQGIGIPAEKLKTVFGRFERAVSAQDYKGLGIGLYITHQIVAAHGGLIHIESKVDKGSSFIVEMPARVTTEKSIPLLEGTVMNA